MPEFAYREIFDLSPDATPYRKLTGDFVSRASFDGNDILKVAPNALTLLAAQGFGDIAHLLRPSHLRQMRAILDDPEASPNDRFVVYDLLKNACVSAGGGSLVTLAKGNRSKAVTDACKKYGGFYLCSVGGEGALLAEKCIKKVECLAYPELGMEAIWRIEVVDFPAFIVVDDKGNDFFAKWTG